ncbi:MAG: hypothetical protein F7B60_05760 [Desulfurococcales archaeon]|nr:hypothetical protein [Desulfurococcales archaeon]
MDSRVYSEFTGREPIGVVLNHADQDGLVVRQGLKGVERLEGVQFQGDDSILHGLGEDVIAGLLAVTGLKEDEGLSVGLCSDVGGAVTRLTLRGVRFELADTPPFPYSVGDEYWFHSVVEGVTGRYKPFLDCRSTPCIIDGSLATGVRRYPMVDGEYMVFTSFNKWLYTPGRLGAVFYTPGFPARLECGEPSPLLLAYVKGVLDYLASTGIEGVESRVLGLTGEYGWLLDKAGYTPLTPPEGEYRAGIVAFSLPLPSGEVGSIRSRLSRMGVRVGFVRKIMRLSPSFYNTVGDIDPVLRLLP